MFRCPHCGGSIIVEKLNCGIFRHGVNLKNGRQINPHASKESISKMEIYGCGKPFRIKKISNGLMIIMMCSYI